MAADLGNRQTQEEHELISASLEVEQIDTNLFRSCHLWKPRRARGVFGGQVISQALVAATKCVEDAYLLHSIHCYFMLSADATIPILYYVDVLRAGKTYVTCSVKAVQRGKSIFMAMCSFQKPEANQPQHAIPVPPNVPPPESCPTEEQLLEQTISKTTDPKKRAPFEQQLTDRRKSPIDIRHVPDYVQDNGSKHFMFWMKAKAIPKYAPHYQKCILAYISDLWFLYTAPRTLGLRWGGQGVGSLAMQSSLDHSLYFYDDDFNHGDWMLYVMTSPRAGSGRAVVQGRIYDRDGKLCAIASQEGVVRAYTETSESQQKSKL